MEEKNSYFQNGSLSKKEALTSRIEIFRLQKGKGKSGSVDMYTLLFLTQGECWFHSDCFKPCHLKEGEAVFIPLNSYFNCTAGVNSTLLVMQGDLFRKQKGAFSLETLYHCCPDDTKEQTSLHIKPLLKEYLKQIEIYLSYDFNYTEFFDLKIQELHILLTRFYTFRELAGFFRSILNSDLAFANFILNNWYEVKNVRELAALSHYCETGFRKKFRQVFGISPYKWIQQKRSARLYYEIVNNEKPFKVIAQEYGFKSLPHLNEYCHRYFNSTPGALRKSQP